MKTFLLLSLVFLLVAAVSTTAFYLYNTSEGARFERLDKPAN